jgi:hypothetical protein
MNKSIELPGLRAETLLGFLATLGAFRLLASTTNGLQLGWKPQGSGWVAELYDATGRLIDAQAVSDEIATALQAMDKPHPVLSWQRFLGTEFKEENEFYGLAASETSVAAEFAAVFTSQVPVETAVGQKKTKEHFDHPFRAARQDYYLGNLESVITNTKAEHIARTVVKSWDYRDAMANQSLRLDHGDDRRHAYQWHAPTSDPARQRTGCMLGANRLAIESFPLFPCIPCEEGSTAIGFDFRSKTMAWFSWPVWDYPCSLDVVRSLVNLTQTQEEEPPMNNLRAMGILSVLRTRRLPIEKNKVFLPPVVF